jgi:16S rRNA U1498 N3-methylase RsmE
VSGPTLRLAASDAARAHARGARSGGVLIALDDEGWEITAELDECTPDRCLGRVIGRRVADERRTKVTLYQGLLPAGDFRRLLASATRIGVVGIAPVVTDSSPLAALPPGSESAAPVEWHDLVRDVAETTGRGRCPIVRPPMLLDRALDEAARSGAIVIVAPIGPPTPSVLVGRPFSVAVFCPSSGGFTAHELTRASARGGLMVGAGPLGPDPVRLPASVLEAVFATLEAAPSA